MSIRPAAPTDAEALSWLICENATALLGPHYTPVQLATFLRYYSVEAMRQKLAAQTVWVAANAEGRLLGTIALDGDLVVGFYTRLGLLGQGVGSALMQHLEQYAAESGLSSLTLASSPIGTEYYRKRGYVPVRTAMMNYLGVDFEETLMVKEL